MNWARWRTSPASPGSGATPRRSTVPLGTGRRSVTSCRGYLPATRGSAEILARRGLYETGTARVRDDSWCHAHERGPLRFRDGRVDPGRAAPTVVLRPVPVPLRLRAPHSPNTEQEVTLRTRHPITTAASDEAWHISMQSALASSPTSTMAHGIRIRPTSTRQKKPCRPPQPSMSTRCGLRNGSLTGRASRVVTDRRGTRQPVHAGACRRRRKEVLIARHRRASGARDPADASTACTRYCRPSS